MTKKITIISLEKTKKKGQYKVYTTMDDYLFDEDVIAKYMIFKDKEFEEKEFKKIINEAQITDLFNKAIKYMAYGPRSKYEIIMYLKGTYGVAFVVKKLIALGYLNDEKLAYDLLEYYKNADKGPLFIKSKLQEKCIDESIINNVLKQYSKEDEINICQKVIDKKLNNLKEYPISKQKTMLFGKLVSRGFHNDVIYSLMQTADYIDESDATIIKDYEKLKIKYSNKDITRYEFKQKILAALLAKGYDYQKINKIIE